MEMIAIIISILAFGISALSFWYGFLKCPDPIFSISRWTAFGITNKGREGSTFILKIDINNPGTKPVMIKDFIIIAVTHNGNKIIYEPIMLWDLTYYIESMGTPKKIVEFQKGQIPLPITIPQNQSFHFDYEILFMPQDKMTTIINEEDVPFEIEVYALTEKWKDYKLISFQKFAKNDIVNLKNGNFVGVLSTSSIENRKKLEKRL